MRLALGRRDDAASSLGVVFKQDPHRAGAKGEGGRCASRSGALAARAPSARCRLALLPRPLRLPQPAPSPLTGPLTPPPPHLRPSSPPRHARLASWRGALLPRLLPRLLLQLLLRQQVQAAAPARPRTDASSLSACVPGGDAGGPRDRVADERGAPDPRVPQRTRRRRRRAPALNRDVGNSVARQARRGVPLLQLLPVPRVEQLRPLAHRRDVAFAAGHAAECDAVGGGDASMHEQVPPVDGGQLPLVQKVVHEASRPHRRHKRLADRIVAHAAAAAAKQLQLRPPALELAVGAHRLSEHPSDPVRQRVAR
mmetsp:Transcript_45325/g.145845  ORF Transcript_45325/g.145845 Transcript_45325/m.145845 type:complete len:311 (+) Transcript_45325:1150-2082(+)